MLAMIVVPVCIELRYVFCQSSFLICKLISCTYSMQRSTTAAVLRYQHKRSTILFLVQQSGNEQVGLLGYLQGNMLLLMLLSQP